MALFTLVPTRLAAAQEVIAIKRGTFVFEAREGSLSLSGTRGFRLAARVVLEGGTFLPYSQCLDPECAPGARLELSANWSGGDIFGTARLRGTTYSPIGGPADDASALIGFSGSITLPAMTGAAVNVTVPFDFAGLFSYGANGPEPRLAVLTGGGMVTLTLVPHPENSRVWLIERAVFRFRPVASRR